MQSLFFSRVNFFTFQFIVLMSSADDMIDLGYVIYLIVLMS